MVCSHLSLLEQELIRSGTAETFRGQAWSDNCREWVYFDTVLDIDAIRERWAFGPEVVIHENLDLKSGLERGFVCTQCHDGIMGKID